MKRGEENDVMKARDSVPNSVLAGLPDQGSSQGQKGNGNEIWAGANRKATKKFEIKLCEVELKDFFPD